MPSTIISWRQRQSSHHMIILTMCFSSPALFITTLERFCLWESKQDESECSSAQNYEAQNAAKLLRLVPA